MIMEFCDGGDLA